MFLLCIGRGLPKTLHRHWKHCICATLKKRKKKKRILMSKAILSWAVEHLCWLRPSSQAGHMCTLYACEWFGMWISDLVKRCVKPSSSQQLPIGCSSEGLRSIVYSSKCLEYIILHESASVTPALEKWKLCILC